MCILKNTKHLKYYRFMTKQNPMYKYWYEGKILEVMSCFPSTFAMVFLYVCLLVMADLCGHTHEI